MAIIRISRSKIYFSRPDPYKVFINREDVGTVSNGETKDFSVPGGQYEVALQSGRNGSRELRLILNDQDVKLIRVKVREMNALFPLILVPPAVYIKIYYGRQPALWFMGVMVVLTLLYSLTWGRKRYLELKECN